MTQDKHHCRLGGPIYSVVQRNILLAAVFESSKRTRICIVSFRSSVCAILITIILWMNIHSYMAQAYLFRSRFPCSWTMPIQPNHAYRTLSSPPQHIFQAYKGQKGSWVLKLEAHLNARKNSNLQNPPLFKNKPSSLQCS